jgi:hypothetical protein
MYGLFIGVDVSKDFFSAVGLDKEGKEGEIFFLLQIMCRQ